MGNGSSTTRSPNTVIVRPTAENQTSFLPRSNEETSSNNSLAIDDVHGSWNQTRLTPTCPQATELLELDDSTEVAAAPQRSNHEIPEGLTLRNLKDKHEKGRRHDDPCDEVVFEVYHCHADGKDYTVINNDGTRFYLDSWATGEWQPFPEEWLNQGHIESNNRSAPNIDTISTSDIQLGDTTSYNVDDERMGALHHPIKGELTTYIMDEQCHVNCVFDPSSGAWLKLPLSWELHSLSTLNMISQIQHTLPEWKDQYEILALLRQCSYNIDETIATYLALLENDSTWRYYNENIANIGGPTEDDMNEKLVEIHRLRKKISQLEKTVHAKDIAIEENHSLQNDLGNQLTAYETTIAQLQYKITCLQSDLEEAKKELENIASLNSISSPKHRSPTPKRRKISPETVVAVKMSLTSLATLAQQLRNSLLAEKENVQDLLQNAVLGFIELRSRNQSNVDQIVELQRLYNQESLRRKLLYNEVQELRGNIRVFCRCRFDAEAKMAVKFPSECEIKAMLPSGDKTFTFDRVFSPCTTQEQVFKDTLPLITSCADGYNVCIMAYGQTGSGKTYTMMGVDVNPGVNVRSIKELLRICKERENVEYTLTVSMLEVYNETLRDLLNDGSPTQLSIATKGKVVMVNELTEIQVNSEESITKIMAKGNANRSVGETKMNTNSSRSHLMLLLHIKGVDQISNFISHGTLTLVDLAGSERISKTEATGQRLVEAAAINKSLSALGQVFTALRTNAMHVPYRNSKLTQLLQGSLGGDGKVCMFVNISPAECNLHESLSTLNFGSGVKQVQLRKAVQNIKKLPK